MEALEILKKKMSKKYCSSTRFDFLDEEEVEMILEAMEEYRKQGRYFTEEEIAKVQEIAYQAGIEAD